MKNKTIINILLRVSLVSIILLIIVFVYIKSDMGAESHGDPEKDADTKAYIYFKKNVAPILGSTCSARDDDGAYICHGADLKDLKVKHKNALDAPRVSQALENSLCDASCHRGSGKNKFSYALDSNGQISSASQLRLAYQKAGKYARHSVIPFAKILRMPLGALAGGFGQYHYGGEIYEDTSHPEYQKLTQWVTLENPATKGKTKKIGAAETFFGNKVLPVYARNGCLNSSCHAFNHSSFFPTSGMTTAKMNLPLKERFSREQVSFNRMTSKGLIQSNIYLTGNIEESRILKKNIPIARGGVLHRGGNDQFFSGPEDPDYQAIKKWLKLERDEAVSKLRINGKKVEPSSVGKLRGVVFVRTKTSNHRRYLDIGKYLPGGDLYILKLKEGETLEITSAKPVNITARFHRGAEADVREPDVRYDGRAIVFAMRKEEKDNLNLYEILLDDNMDYVAGSFRRLTYGPKKVNDVKVHYTDPLYVPDPLDKNAASGGYNLEKVDLVFASNISGNLIPSVEHGIVGEADGGDQSALIDFDRPEVDGTFVGRHIFIVDGTNKGEWRKITAFKNKLFTKAKRSYISVNRPFPKPIDNSTIYVIERDPKTQPGFLPSYSMYGLKYSEPGQERRMYEETLSRITHGVAQGLDLSVRTTGEVFFACQRSFMNKYDRPIFNVASCRRHLDTRFSFPTHHGNRSQVLIYADNYEMPSGLDIHNGLDPDNLWEGGNLSVSDHQMGPGLEARNPNDYTTGYFDEDGIPVAEKPEYSNVRYKFKKGELSHTRFIFKKIPLFPLRGPEAVSRTGFSPGGVFRDPVPLPSGDILVSHSPKPLNHLDPTANPDFDLYIIRGDPSLHSEGGKGVPKVKKIKLRVAGSAGWSDIQSQPIHVRMKPKINAAKRPKKESLIKYPGTAKDNRPAKYLERNFLIIDAVMNDPSPVGKKTAYKTNPMTGEKTPAIDEIKYVRMVEVLPTPPDLAVPLDINKVGNRDPQSTLISNGVHLMKRIVGEAPLESDGSIYIKIPSKIPLIIQSLNKDKMALRQEARHYFFAPNETFTISPSPSETFQTCAACMGAMSPNPEKLFGPVNKFSGQLKVKAIAKAKDNIPEYGADEEQRITIDFVRDIQPLLDKHCASCHSGPNPPRNLRLTGEKTTYYSVAYENLTRLEDPASRWFARKKYISERNALAIESYLIEKLYGLELKARRKLENDFPHPSAKLLQKHNVQGASLSEKEKLLFVRWIDMGAVFRGVKHKWQRTK